MVKKAKPETHAQARWWDRRCNGYVRFGLCYRCAAQASWGHQLGFADIHSPCAACAPIVDTFPVERINGWRTHSDRDLSARQQELVS